jgi:hypothetical protein
MTSIIEYVPNQMNLILYSVVFTLLNHLLLSLLLMFIAKRNQKIFSYVGFQ